MKTLIKLDELELVKSINQLVIMQNGYCKAKFHQDQLLPAVVQFIALSKRPQNKISAKFMAILQPELF